MAKVNRAILKIIFSILKLYKYCVSPLLGNCCRFYPSCSDYSYQSINQYGLIYGSYLALRRLLRCAPWSKGGIDLVPEKTQ